jgi:bis(5'-nucleosyl)-tetraphosphatase (symmetrical)
MKNSRTIVIGDVHGCIAELDELLLKVEYRVGKDRLVFAGDLVDRGPDSVAVVRRARELEAECVLGNHEDKHIRFAKWTKKLKSGEVTKHPMKFDEHKTKIQSGLSEDDIRWLKELPLYIRLGKFNGRKFVVVHGGLEFNKPIEKQPKNMMRIRYVNQKTGIFMGSQYIGHQPEGSQYWSELWSGPESIIYGHAVWAMVRTDSFPGGYTCYGIDTGCCFGGTLTAMILPEKGAFEFIDVKAKEKYYDYNGFRE